MDSKIVEKISGSAMKKRPSIKIGDTLQVSIKIKEAGRERTQIFEGIFISTSGSGIDKTITVRKISYGIGVERIFPLYSPSIENIKIIKRGDVRRSKLYYMRGKKGKKAMDVGNSGESFEGEVVEDIAPAVKEPEEKAQTEEKSDDSKEVPEETVKKDNNDNSKEEKSVISDTDSKTEEVKA